MLSHRRGVPPDATDVPEAQLTEPETLMRTLKTLAAFAMLSIFGIGCSSESDSGSGSYYSTSTRSTSQTGTGSSGKLATAKDDQSSKADKGKGDTRKSSATEVKSGKTETTATAPKKGKERLHGKWSGITKVEQFGVTMQLDAKFEFKPDGRVFWHEKAALVNDQNAPVFETAVEGSGTYTITRIEDDRFTLKLSNDLDPDRTFGWVITFKGQDQITVTGFEDVPVTVQRKK